MEITLFTLFVWSTVYRQLFPGHECGKDLSMQTGVEYMQKLVVCPCPMAVYYIYIFCC